MSTYRRAAPVVLGFALCFAAFALIGCGDDSNAAGRSDGKGKIAWTDTYALAFETAEETGQNVMLIFWKPGEDQSDALIDDAMMHKPITDRVADFIPVSVILNSPATIQLSIRHEVNARPCTIFLTADREEIGRVSGYDGIDWYLDELTAALEGS